MLNSDIYNLWFGPVRATALDGDQLTLEVANDFCEVWLKDNYLGLIQDVLMHAAGQQLKVRFVVGATAAGATRLQVDALGDVFGAFAGYGVWEFDPVRGWKQLNATDAPWLAVA